MKCKITFQWCITLKNFFLWSLFPHPLTLFFSHSMLLSLCVPYFWCFVICVPMTIFSTFPLCLNQVYGNILIICFFLMFYIVTPWPFIYDDSYPIIFGNIYLLYWNQNKFFVSGLFESSVLKGLWKLEKICTTSSVKCVCVIDLIL